MYEMAKEESDDELKESLLVDLAETESNLKALELKKMLDGADDSLTAIVTINPGSGGTESCDWANMLFRMYTRY